MSIRNRFLGIASLAALSVSLVAAPAAAGSSTIWVDDDGQAGPTSCGGGAAAASSVQDGLDAAGTGATVKVCPGVYRELVTIDTEGVTLTAVKPWKAVIRHPSPTAAGRRPAGDTTLVRVAADGVTVQWLKVVAPSQPGCTNAGGILANSVDDVSIRGNRVRGGSTESSHNCGLGVGIEVTNADGLVAWNSVRNYFTYGIAIFQSDVKAFRNSIHWAHTGDGCRALACTSGFGPAGGPSQPAIMVSQSDATVERNHVEVDAGAGFPSEGGIAIAGSDVDVLENTVIGFNYGITAGYGSEGRILRNTVRRGDDQGILIYSNVPGTSQFSPIFIVRGNRVRGFAVTGMALQGATDNLIRGNDFTSNPGTDCYDAADPTQSVWIDNLGDESEPPGLCEVPV